VKSSEINRYSGYYTNGKAFSPSRIAECINTYHVFIAMHDRRPSISKFIIVSKISKRELALKYKNHIKNNTSLVYPIQGHSLTSAFSILDLIGKMHLNLHASYLSVYLLVKNACSVI